jgi:hypothetical protein
MTERVETFEYDIDIVLLALLFRNLKDRLEAPVGLSNPLQIRNDSQSGLACRRLPRNDLTWMSHSFKPLQ